MSKAQQVKDEILAGLAAVRSQILTAAAALPAAKQDQVFLGVWSVADLLAHLVGWDYANLQGAQQVQAGELPEFYAHIDPDWRGYNASLVARYKQANFSDLLASTQRSHRALLEHLQTIPAEEFEKDQGVRYRGYKVTIARLLQAETKDEHVHLQQIEQYAAQA